MVWSVANLLRRGAAEPKKLSRYMSGFENASPNDIALVEQAFDREFYLKRYPDVAASGLDPLYHYLAYGWKEGRDPTATFSTVFYLSRNGEIQRAGVNPFVHFVLRGAGEKRPSAAYGQNLDLIDYAPKVSAIIPNYNHARFLEQRIDSILNQTYKNVEILILDDCSVDDSRNVIARYHNLYPQRVRSLFNTQNSGNPFKQWRLGIEHSDGDLIWICESDDFCERDFLEVLVRRFKDPSVTLAFGRIQFCQADGTAFAGLDNYREGAEPGIWNEPVCRPAADWFANGFGVNNVIANVGGCLWKRKRLSNAVWNEAATFSVLGDWFLYSHIAGGGQIAYDPDAVAYFRQHGSNTSVRSFTKLSYYTEHRRLMTALRERWGVPESTVDKFCSKVAYQYTHHKLESEYGSLEQYLSKEALLAVPRRSAHILIAFLGFEYGGGEVFSIALANELHEQGHIVSMMALRSAHVDLDLKAMLNPAIPVYLSSHIEEAGLDAFLAKAGISLIHSHVVAVEWFFIEQCSMKTEIPYLVTMHGSYEACEVRDDLLLRCLRKVSHWVYTADKNLTVFHGLPLRPGIFTKMLNGMPIDPRSFPKNRKELGVDTDAVVFTLVARGIERKGWRASIQAFIRLRDARPSTKMHLFLVGQGDIVDSQSAVYGSDPDISFLGFQSCINGLYRISDCALVPTRFAGESLPLCIIQAMQEGTPVIATRIGEIEQMITPPTLPAAGILLECERNTEHFIDRLGVAMAEMLDPDRRKEFSAGARANAERYNMSHVATRYANLYSALLAPLGVEKP